MDAFTTHTGVGVPLRRSNVDTDQIIPAVYLKRVTRDGFEDGLFAAWRNDESFVLNNPRYAAGSVLVAGPDFRDGLLARARRLGADELRVPGRASPRVRRHLPRQLRQAGAAHRAGRAGRHRAHLEVPREQAGAQVTVDLAARTVTAGDIVAPFDIDDYTSWRLMEGLDDIGLTLRHEDLIEEFESGRAAYLPVTR
jgi:3-isopropylmalate/(R)-2-methylmalate dehydratase small subunit